MRPAIEATALGKRYGRTWALRDCCLRIPTARITALIGPNGAGKTTLLNLAIGILAPDAGEIETLGWSPHRQPALVLGRVGYVPQDRPLYARFTVADTLHIGRALNPKWDEHGARERLRKRDIPLDRPIRMLSGGQRAQVSLALALGKRPELLLLDEPASSLDPATLGNISARSTRSTRVSRFSCTTRAGIGSSAGEERSRFDGTAPLKIFPQESMRWGSARSMIPSRPPPSRRSQPKSPRTSKAGDSAVGTTSFRPGWRHSVSETVWGPIGNRTSGCFTTSDPVVCERRHRPRGGASATSRAAATDAHAWPTRANHFRS